MFGPPMAAAHNSPQKDNRMDSENQVNSTIPDSLTSKLAIASLALGIVGLVMCCLAPAFAIPSIICGHLALKRISASKGTVKDKARAIFGLIMGYLGLLVFILLCRGEPNHKKAAMSNCAGNIKYIVQACSLYAKEHQDLLPPDLDTLLKTKLIERPKQLICPNDRDAKITKQPSYLYFGAGLKLDDLDDKTILVAEKNRFHATDRLMIGFADVRVELITEPGDLATIARKHGWKLGAEKNATNATPPKAP
jgi:hypothetical protein